MNDINRMESVHIARWYFSYHISDLLVIFHHHCQEVAEGMAPNSSLASPFGTYNYTRFIKMSKWAVTKILAICCIQRTILPNYIGIIFSHYIQGSLNEPIRMTQQECQCHGFWRFCCWPILRSKRPRWDGLHDLFIGSMGRICRSGDLWELGEICHDKPVIGCFGMFWKDLMMTLATKTNAYGSWYSMIFLSSWCIWFILNQ